MKGWGTRPELLPILDEVVGERASDDRGRDDNLRDGFFAQTVRIPRVGV